MELLTNQAEEGEMTLKSSRCGGEPSVYWNLLVSFLRLHLTGSLVLTPSLRRPTQTGIRQETGAGGIAAPTRASAGKTTKSKVG